MISQGIWNIRLHTNFMILAGNGYTSFDNDLKYIDGIIGIVESSRLMFNESEELRTQLIKYEECTVQFRDEMEHNNIIVADVVSNGTAMLNTLNSIMTKVDREMELQVSTSENNAVFSLIAVGMAALASVISAVIMTVYIKSSIVSVLSKSVDNIKSVSDKVVVSSHQLNDGSSQLAEGVNKQAASIEETSATMNQTAAMVRQTKENTVTATDLSGKCEQNASKSVQEVMHLTEIINNLYSSSNEVSRIVDTMDAIASQINILALNASVESARAGEAGKSFGVVAEEVRNLAIKSAEAVTDTANIISKNATLTQQGSMRVKEVDKSLNIIFDDVQKINALLTEISSASEEQSRGIDQINEAISQMEKVTQSSAAIAQQSSASANDMLSSSETLALATREISGLI